MSFVFNPLPRPFDIKGAGGTSSSSPDNFSYREIGMGEELEIPFEQEMLLKSPLRIQGTLILRGSLRFVGDEHDQMSHWKTIPVGEVVVIPKNRSMFYKNSLTIRGLLRVQGSLEAIA